MGQPCRRHNTRCCQELLRCTQEPLCVYRPASTRVQQSSGTQLSSSYTDTAVMQVVGMKLEQLARAHTLQARRGPPSNSPCHLSSYQDCYANNHRPGCEGAASSSPAGEAAWRSSLARWLAGGVLLLGLGHSSAKHRSNAVLLVTLWMWIPNAIYGPSLALSCLCGDIKPGSELLSYSGFRTGSMGW